jgi:sugar/nucleoside kinase (ribokinase family)
MRVGCLGELLVEIMRDRVDVPFDVPDIFVGPFPSGAPAIFADCLARLGEEVFFVGAVGEDDFGKMILRRLKEDGVDIGGVKILPDFTTGVAFVTYFRDENSFITYLKLLLARYSPLILMKNSFLVWITCMSWAPACSSMIIAAMLTFEQ